MYVCNDCKKRFNESYSVVGSGDYYNTCPRCSSANYRELHYTEIPLDDQSVEQRLQTIELKLSIRKKLIPEYF